MIPAKFSLGLHLSANYVDSVCLQRSHQRITVKEYWRTASLWNALKEIKSTQRHKKLPIFLSLGCTHIEVQSIAIDGALKYQERKKYIKHHMRNTDFYYHHQLYSYPAGFYHTLIICIKKQLAIDLIATFNKTQLRLSSLEVEPLSMLRLLPKSQEIYLFLFVKKEYHLVCLIQHNTLLDCEVIDPNFQKSLKNIFNHRSQAPELEQLWVYGEPIPADIQGQLADFTLTTLKPSAIVGDPITPAQLTASSTALQNFTGRK